MLFRSNVFRSDGIRHGKPPARPITPLRPAATMREIFKLSVMACPAMSDVDKPSHGYRRLDVRMRVVAGEAEILKSEIEDRRHVRIELKARQAARLP